MNKFKLLAIAALSIVPIRAQMVCQVANAVNGPVRANGLTELLNDVLLECTGGTPTPAGQAVPVTNFTFYLNTNITSKITYGGSTNFTEALLLIDEPNRPIALNGGGVTSHPVLNCGQSGAADNGPYGSGMCGIVSTGVPQQTYDGTACAGANVFGCGRPNVFQGVYADDSSNAISFLRVPVDAPPAGGIRYLRFTNIRANATTIQGGYSAINAAIWVTAQGPIVFTGGTQAIGAPLGTVATPQPPSIAAKGVIRLWEGFEGEWKPRNVATAVANSAYAAGKRSYVSPDDAYPAQAAQNVPGVTYKTEDGFQWQNTGVNAAPSPNPPSGYAVGFAQQSNHPLKSFGFGGINTGIDQAGVSNAGTRIALTFQTSAPTVTVPAVVYLHPGGSPSTTSGVMVLVATDASGAGTFSPATTTTIKSGASAVYEVVYSDTSQVEYADIQCTPSNVFYGAAVTVNMAPFYSTVGANYATPTAAHVSPTPIPRFAPSGLTITLPPVFVLSPILF